MVITNKTGPGQLQLIVVPAYYCYANLKFSSIQVLFLGYRLPVRQPLVGFRHDLSRHP